MEKARLSITKTSKNNYVASLTFENGKSQPISDYKPQDDKQNGK